MQRYKGYKITLPLKVGRYYFRCYVTDLSNTKIYISGGTTKRAAVKLAKQFINQNLKK